MLNLETSQEPEACAVLQHPEDREVHSSWDKDAEKQSAGQCLETQKPEVPWSGNLSTMQGFCILQKLCYEDGSYLLSLKEVITHAIQSLLYKEMAIVNQFFKSNK